MLAQKNLRSRHTRTLGLLFAAALSVSSSAYAMRTEDASAPASAPTTSGTVEVLTVTVTGVEGNVQVRTGEDQPWQRVAVGMQLSQDAEFRTSLRSAVQIRMDGGQTITLDRLGTIKVVQAVNDSGKFKTKIGMKYGRTRYDIESAGQEHEASISSPSSTLAIRGTDVSLTDQRPFPTEAVSLTGRALFQDSKKKVFLGNKGAGKLKVDGNNASAAQYALNQSVVDPSLALARSQSEQGLINAVLSTGSTISYDQQKGIKVVTGGRPLTDNQLATAFPGALNFVLRWTGNADLNLAVIGPGISGNRTVYPLAGFDITASGGKTAFDHRGGPNGGIEVVSWPKSFPEGIYRIGSAHISGVESPATLDVFLNGKRVDIVNTINGPGPSKTVGFISGPVNPAFGTGQAIGEVRLFPSQGITGTQSVQSVKTSKVTKSK